MTPSSPAVGHADTQVRQDAALEHLRHLVGDAGDGVDHLVADGAESPVRCLWPGG